MPLSALPQELQDVENHFPDDDQYNKVPVFGRLYRWYQKTTKTWFAFSYRCTEWWARWRKYPKVLLAVSGKGSWRYEFEQYGDVVAFGSRVIFNESLSMGYLSRIQYYKRWHLAIQWPLIVNFHFYFRESDVPKPGEPRPDLDGKLLYFYWNHFDADLVYWMITSIFIGTGWK